MSTKPSSVRTSPWQIVVRKCLSINCLLLLSAASCNKVRMSPFCLQSVSTQASLRTTGGPICFPFPSNLTTSKMQVSQPQSDPVLLICEVLMCTYSSDPLYRPMDGPVQDRMLWHRDSYSEAPYKQNSDRHRADITEAWPTTQTLLQALQARPWRGRRTDPVDHQKRTY